MVVGSPSLKTISDEYDIQVCSPSFGTNAIAIEQICSSLSRTPSLLVSLPIPTSELPSIAYRSGILDPDELPFTLLNGEDQIESSSISNDDTIFLTTYRLFMYSTKAPYSFINCPLRLIDSIETRENLYLFVRCKDLRSFCLTFTTAELCQDWIRKLSELINPPISLEHLFGLRFASSLMDDISQYSDRSYQDFQRLNLHTYPWRITYINRDYQFCKTYPAISVVPNDINDEQLKAVTKFRSYQRFPAVVWRHSNGAVIARTSQPEVGWLLWRSPEDEKLIQAIIKACVPQIAVDGNVRIDANCHRLTILDARSYPAAIANRAKGGGFEYPQYYTNCDVRFMNLPNIHAIRKSAQALRTAISNIGQSETWLSQLESTRWLQNLSMLINVAILVVKEVDIHARPVLIHCSDGWDRTPQITTLSKIMLDPYYRTIKGFQILVQQEWIGFGHKFAQRCGHDVNSNDPNERSPVFMQWLDCVYQLYRQKPVAFEFNEMFLLKLAHHTYTCLHGTFLCNNDHERKESDLEKKTLSIWSLLNDKSPQFRNFLFDEKLKEILYPSASVRDLKIWSNLYLRDIHQTSTGSSEDLNTTSTLNTPSLQSFDELSTSMNNGLHRSSSDSQLTGSMSLESSSVTLKTSNPLISTPPNSVTQQSSLVRSQNSASTNSLFGPPHHLGTLNGSNHNMTHNTSNSNSVTTSPTTNNGSAYSFGFTVPNKNHDSPDNQLRRQSFTTDDSASDLTQLGPSVQRCQTNTNGVENMLRSAANSLHQTTSTSSTGSNKSDNWLITKPQIQDSNGCKTLQQSIQSSAMNGDNPSSNIRKRIDVDGLTKIPDPVTERMLEKEFNFIQQKQIMQGQIQQLQRLCENLAKRDHSTSPAKSLNHNGSAVVESLMNGKKNSPDASSLSSWQKIDPNEGAITRWVPDFKVDMCRLCRIKFQPWPLSRKHHCRKCGDVFCHSCTNYSALVPELDLSNRVRVCRDCFAVLEDQISRPIEAPSSLKTTTPIPIQNGCRETNGSHKGSFNSVGGQKVKG